MALGGPVFTESLHGIGQMPNSFRPVLVSFRRWVFGIDGDWSLALEQRASGMHPFNVLEEVIGVVKILHQGDTQSEDVSRLVRVSESAMQRADLRDKRTRSVASDLVAVCIEASIAQEIFTSVDLEILTTALASMEERAKQQKDAD